MMKPDEAIEEIQSIINNPNCRYSYFFAANSLDVLFTISEALIGHVDILDTSYFCNSTDAIPDINALINKIKNRDKSIMVRGLDGYLSMKNKEDVGRIYRQINSISSSNGAAIILCYGSKELKQFEDDPRAKERIHIIDSDHSNNLRITLINPCLELEGASNGLKPYLEEIEKKPPKSRYYVQTMHYNSFEEGIIDLEEIVSYKDYVTKIRSYGEVYLDIETDRIWKDFYLEAKDHVPLSQIYHKHFGNDSIKNVLDSITKPYDIWLFVSYWKNNPASTKHPYIDHVVQNSSTIEDFKYNLIFSLLDYNIDDPQFNIVYKERKLYLNTRFVKKLSEYCSKVTTKYEPINGIYYLTDSTNEEKESILTLIKKHGSIDERIKNAIQNSYSDLFEYIRSYVGYDEYLKKYFDSYKECKILSKIPEQAFLSLVNENIKDPKYIKKEARDKVFKNIYEEGDKVFFIDGLGIEYLSLIETICEEYDLEAQIEVCRSNLPSITSANIEVIKDIEYQTEKYLDILAHKQDVSEEYCKGNLFIVKQLDYIRRMVSVIQNSIKNNEAAIIYSDHGLSRTYVLNGQKEELNWDVESEHNGRCAKINQSNFSAPNVKKESNYYVVADYARIKNDIQKAKIEAHGGATLEEVLVPLIKLTNSNRQFIECEIPDEIILDPITGRATMSIYYSEDTDKLILLINGREFKPTKDMNNYTFTIEELAAGSYDIRILDNRRKIKDSKIRITGKGMKKNNNLFNKLR